MAQKGNFSVKKTFFGEYGLFYVFWGFCALSVKIFAQDGGHVLQDAFRHVGLVHRVDVHVCNTVGVQVDNLVGGVDDARLLHGFGVATELVDERLEALRHEGARKLDGAFHLVRVRDGHDAGEHRAVHARVAQLVEEAEEQVVVEDHLRGEEVRARVHLFLEVLDVFSLVCALGVLLGVAGSADAEVRVALLEFADEFHGVVVVAVVASLLDEFRSEVAAQRHHVLDARRLHFLDPLVHRVLAARNAGEVGEHRDAELLLQVLRDIEGVVAHSAARAVGDAHERGAEGGDGFGRGFHAFEARFLLGREHFERKTHLVLLQDIDDFHITSRDLNSVSGTGLAVVVYANILIHA